MDESKKMELSCRRFAHDLFLISRYVGMHGMMPQQVAVLCLLYRHPDGYQARVIREMVGVSKSACYTMLDVLTRCGDVSVQAVRKPAGKAVNVYRLSDQGRRMVRAWHLDYWHLVLKRTAPRRDNCDVL